LLDLPSYKVRATPLKDGPCSFSKVLRLAMLPLLRILKSSGSPEGFRKMASHGSPDGLNWKRSRRCNLFRELLSRSPHLILSD
jgi:hypothetical protein